MSEAMSTWTITCQECEACWSTFGAQPTDTVCPDCKGPIEVERDDEPGEPDYGAVSSRERAESDYYGKYGMGGTHR